MFTTSLFGNTNFFFFLKSDTWALVRLQVGGSLHNMNANSATDYFFFSPTSFSYFKEMGSWKIQLVDTTAVRAASLIRITGV